MTIKINICTSIVLKIKANEQLVSTECYVFQKVINKTFLLLRCQFPVFLTTAILEKSVLSFVFTFLFLFKQK